MNSPVIMIYRTPRKKANTYAIISRLSNVPGITWMYCKNSNKIATKSKRVSINQQRLILKFQMHPIIKQYENIHNPSGNIYFIHAGMRHILSPSLSIEFIMSAFLTQSNIGKLVDRNNRYTIPPTKRIIRANKTVIIWYFFSFVADFSNSLPFLCSFCSYKMLLNC